ncbi:MAG: hypothetical protein AB8F65_05800 [Woeseiaceae bacterium]
MQNLSLGFGGPGNLFSVIALLTSLLYLFLAAIAAMAINKDAAQREKRVLNLEPYFWALGAFVFTPILAVAVYWLLHYSKWGLDKS